PHPAIRPSSTSRGLGDVSKRQLVLGCRKFIIGLGGSATNDGGIGMLQALGYGFFDAGGNAVPFGAKGLEKLSSISMEGSLPLLREAEFHVACDVKNPLCGPNGSSAVFGPQKGADKTMVRQMDGWMESYAGLAKERIAGADRFYPGAGAAGGLGFAFHTFLNAALEPGIEIVMRETGLEEKVKKADIVVTGEGCLDGQTTMGKAPMGVAGLAQKYKKPVIAFAGCTGEGVEKCNEKGIDAYFSILQKVVSVKEAMDTRTAERNVENTAEQVFRLVHRLWH
ncbi:MAG: glycerate kinase, partial [Lachnospiraceae bacterium]|nr:glycerate kinase [Lachnospiraceae bacterium]